MCLSLIDRWISIVKLKSQEQRISSPYMVMNSFRGVGEYQSIKAKQVKEEIEALGALVTLQRPKTIMEIGTYRGGTLYMWCKLAPDDAHILACDLPSDSLENAFSLNRRRFYAHFAKPGQKLELIAYNSQKQSTVDLIKAKLMNKKLDFLFIDGDHSYKGVKADFELYEPFVRKGGLIAFHDILFRETTPQIEVYKLWDQLKKRYKFKEFISKSGKYANLIGIGVIWK